MSIPTCRPRTTLVLAVAAIALIPGTSGVSSAASAPQPVLDDPLVDVGAPALSYSGRQVAHLAMRRDRTSPPQQVRRTNLATGRSELLNPSTDGGVARGNVSRPPVISADGSRVAFTSTARRMVPGDTNGRADAFVRDARTNTTVLVSRAFDGGVSNGASGMTTLSKNGRYAVFTSSGTDVVRGSTTTNVDVYRRDLSTDRTVQVTVRANGSPSRGPGSSSADVSADGNLVAFASYNTDLAATDGADGEADLFVRTMSTGSTRWISRGLPAGANPSGVVMSPDGRWVSSRWDDGSLHLTGVRTGVTSTVAREGYALLGSFSSRLARFVFMAAGTPHVRDLSTGVDEAIPVPDGGQAVNVTISGSGRFVAYDWVPADGSASRIFRVALD